MKKGIITLLVALFMLGLPGEAFGRSADAARWLNQRGVEAYNHGRYQEALRYLGEALKIQRELNVPQDIAMSLNNIGEVYVSLGRYDEALRYHGEALKIRRELNVPQDIAQSLNNIGTVYHSLGRYDEALRYLGEALKIWRELNVPQYIATSLNNIGLVYCSLGRYDEALRYHGEALKILRELNLPQYIAGSLNNIGSVYDSLGRYDEALRYHGEALKIWRELNIPQDIAANLDNIGCVYLALKDYKKAEGQFKEAEKERTKTGFKGTPGGTIEVYLATGRHKEALMLLEERTPGWYSGLPYQIQYYTKRGLALKGINKFKEATGEFLRAVSMTEEMRQGVKGEKTGFFGAGYYGGRIRAYRGLFSALSERAIKGEKGNEGLAPYGKDLTSSAFYFSEATKARVLLEAMAESAKKGQSFEIPEELKKKEQSLLDQISAIDSQWESAYKIGEEALKRLVERKEGLAAELNKLINELRRDYPRYAAVYYPKPVPPDELPLRDDEVLLEYALGDDAGYVFVVRKGGVRRHLKIPVPRGALEAKVKAFMEPLNSLSPERFSVKEARGLYDILLSEALKEVSESERIIIIPDGILGLLPFEALAIKEGAGVKDTLYVGDRYTLSYYQSAAVLALQRGLKGGKAGRALFALGNPVYSKEDVKYVAYKQGKPQPDLTDQDIRRSAFHALATGSEWGRTRRDDKDAEELVFPPLPETETEVKTIARLFDVQTAPPDVLLGIWANETNLRKSPLKDYRYLHFATHADLPGKVQGIKEPFILLGQVENEGDDDGFLTLGEVSALSLNADMVVLSACLTGRGKAMEGEGVVNFARTFHHAGARSVVVSLWEVASKEAVTYMELFYGHLKDGNGSAEALRLARNKIKAKYPNPFYWAVFILHGE